MSPPEANPFPPEVHIQATKAEIDPFAVEIGPTDRVLIGAAGALALAGDIAVAGTKDRFHKFSEGLKGVKNSLSERFQQRRLNQSDEEEPHRSLLDLEKDAVTAKGNGDWMGYQRAVLKIADYIDRQEAKGDSHKEAYDQMRLWIDKKLTDAPTLTERQEREHQQTAHQDRVIQLTTQAEATKSAGDWSGYQKATLDLASTIEQGEASGLTSQPETAALVTQIDKKLKPVAAGANSLANQTLKESKQREIEALQQTKEWLDPRNILGLRRLIEYKVATALGNAQAAPELVQNLTHQSTTEALATYFGVTPAQLENGNNIPTDVYDKVLQILHLPVYQLENIAARFDEQERAALGQIRRAA